MLQREQDLELNEQLLDVDVPQPLYGVVFKHGYKMGKAAEERTTKRRRFVEKRGEHS